MTDINPGWRRAFPLSQIPSGGAKLFRDGDAQIAVFRRPDPDGDRLYAVDNRCPHEGYPLLQGSIVEEARGCVLTCKWHNFKFRLEDGACVMGQEGVRAYPVRRSADADPWVEIDLAPPPALIAGLWDDLLIGLRKQETGRMARTVVRLLDLGIAPADILTAAARYACDHGEYGISHAPALASELAAPPAGFGPGLSLSAPPELQIVQALDLAARSALGNPPRPRPDPADPGPDPIQAGERLRHLVESEQAEAAESLVRGAVARGWREAELLPWFARLCADHFLDFGHMLIYTERIFALLDQTGWKEADALLGGLIYAVTCATREDLLPKWSAWRRHMAERRAAPHDSPTHDSPPHDHLTPDRLTDSPPAEAFALVAGSLGPQSAHPPHPTLDALSIAAATRILRFDVAIDADPTVEEGWLDLTHRLTFVHAVRAVAVRLPDTPAHRDIVADLCLQAAHFVAAARPLDAPTPEAAPPATAEATLAAATPAAIADLCRRYRPAEAVAAAVPLITPDAACLAELCDALEGLIWRDHATRAIFLAHHVKTLRAARRETVATGDPRPMLAAIRLIASPIRERSVERATLDAIRLVREGKPPRSLS